MEDNQANYSAELSDSTGASSVNHKVFLLAHPVLDKLIAFVAVLPFLFYVFRVMQRGTLDLVPLGIAFQHLLIVVTMLARRTPVRVSTNPWYWALTFMATYWLWLTAAYTPPGVFIVPPRFSGTLALLGLLTIVYARISLGRNIGLVPAQRRLVTGGAYRLVRHPIYTGIFFNYLASLFAAYSNVKVIIVGLGIFWFVLKSIIEERFLAEDPEYVKYMQQVRWRWLPWIA